MLEDVPEEKLTSSPVQLLIGIPTKRVFEIESVFFKKKRSFFVKATISFFTKLS